MKFSQVESDRFNMKVFRGSIQKPDPKQIRKVIVENEVDLLILRVPVQEKQVQHRLADVGFDLIHADTLVYYSCDLEKTELKQMKSQLDFEPVTTDNVEVMQEIVPVIFQGYQNHYFSNPYLDPVLINRGYIEWASGYIHPDEGKCSWLVKENGEVIGFATCAFDRELNEAEGVLYGVMPSAAGRGIYSDIIRFTQSYFKTSGYKSMIVSTQIQNIAVQKVWGREGFTLSNAYDTYHINSMLRYSTEPEYKESFRMNSDLVHQFASFSGDWNPVHFDDAFAVDNGFSGRISHGLIPVSFMSKTFATHFPGPGTLFLSNRTIFLQPLYPDQEYRIVYCTLKKDLSGRILIVAKLFNADSKLCIVSYSNLFRRATA